MTLEEKSKVYVENYPKSGAFLNWRDLRKAYQDGYKDGCKEAEAINPTSLSESVGDEATQAYGIDFQQERPDHYRKFGFEVWDMMRKQFGDILFYAHLKMAALEYQMRVGHKEGQTESDLRKIKTLFDLMELIENENPNIEYELKTLINEETE